MSELKSNGKPAGLGSRSTMRCAAAAAACNAAGTSLGSGSVPLRTISTTWAVAIDENPHGIDKRESQYVHGEINGAAAADFGACVVPLGAGRENLELAA
jgi:hypothetical protein